MIHIYKQHSTYEAKVDPKCCRQAVHQAVGARFHQCSRRGVIERVVEKKKYLFCKIHDPEFVAAKQKREKEKWQKEREIRDLERDIDIAHDRIVALVLSEEFSTKPSKVMAKIAKLRATALRLQKQQSDNMGKY